MDAEERRLIGIDIKTVEYGFPIGMPTCRPMGNGLYEVRTDLPQGRKARVLFFIHQGSIVLLHGFIKKKPENTQERIRFSFRAKTASGGNVMKKNPYIGSSLDDLFEEEGTLEEINIIAIKRVIAWQIQQEMITKKLSKTEMAQKMKTSRSSLERLLDPDNSSVTLDTIGRAASVIGKRVRLELID